jgi:vacuolar-type H+-ATPase subunit I/STV1
MDFFNNLGKKIGNTAKSVTKKSEELVEATKVNMAIDKEEDKIKKLMLEIGLELYSKFTAGESFGDELDEKCAQIKAVEDNIADLRDKVKNLKAPKVNEVNTEVEEE